MSNYKLKFTLKQHTPIIHFQHDQHGATLRASELKPKLDKFLIEKLELAEVKTIDGKEKEVPKNIYNKWFINEGKQHLALDYKVKIEDVENVTYYLPLALTSQPQKGKNAKDFILDYYRKYYSENFDFDFLAPTPYFANQDKIKFGGFYNNQKLNKDIVNLSNSKPEELRFAIQSNSGINLTISSFVQNKINNKTLLEQIEDCIEEFFIVKNFGARQNKGFGSFTLDTTSYQVFMEKIEHSKNIIYNKKVKCNSQNNIFKCIDLFYKKIKNNSASKESKIKEYFENKNIIWEKPFVLQKIVKNKYSEKKNIRFVRALLGLAEQYDYQQLNVKVKIIHTERNKDKQIERFHSPIIFKVFENNIFLFVEKDNFISKIVNQEFWFYIGDNLENAKVKEKLQVPKDFDIIEFVKQI